jgi:hypothetical protein
MLPAVIKPHPQPLPVNGEGRQSVAVVGWGSSGFINNQADMISVLIANKATKKTTGKVVLLLNIFCDDISVVNHRL